MKRKGRLLSKHRKQKNTKPRRRSLMLRRQPNRDVNVDTDRARAGAKANNKVQGRDKGGEGPRVC